MNITDKANLFNSMKKDKAEQAKIEKYFGKNISEALNLKES